MKSSEIAQDAINKARALKKESCNKENEFDREERPKIALTKIAVLLSMLFIIIYSINIENNNSKKYNKSNKNIYKSRNDSKKGTETSIDEKTTSSVVQYHKRKAAMYILHFKNGKRTMCKNAPDVRNGMVTISEHHITTKFPASDLTKIEWIWQ